jgi:LEA14-like dessication related protein
MKKLTIWALLPLLLIGCAKPTGFDYLGIRNLKVLQFGLKESTVGLDVEYYNPNKFPVTMKSADVDVYVNNNYFGKTLLDSTIKVPRRDTFLLPVVLKVSMNSSVLKLLQAWGQGQQEVLLKMEGKARIGRGGIFINYPIRYEAMQKLEF